MFPEGDLNMMTGWGDKAPSIEDLFKPTAIEDLFDVESVSLLDFFKVSPDDDEDDMVDSMLGGLSDDFDNPSPSPSSCSSLSSFQEDYNDCVMFVSPETCLPVEFSKSYPRKPTDTISPMLSCLDSIFKDVSVKDEFSSRSYDFEDACKYRGDWLSAHDVAINNSLSLNCTKHILDDHCYSAKLPEVDIKVEVVDDEYSNTYSPRSISSTSSEPDVETMPFPNGEMPIKQEPEPQVVPKSIGKNMSLLLPKQPATTKRKRGRKPKNPPPAKKGRVGRPRTVKNAGYSAADLEAPVASRGKNTRRKRKNVASPPSSCSSVQDEDSLDMRLSDEKRASHNLAERERRQQMSSLFTNLKNKVPTFAGLDKVSKVTALQDSAKYVKHYEAGLKANEYEVLRQKNALVERLTRLKALVKKFRRIHS